MSQWKQETNINCEYKFDDIVFFCLKLLKGTRLLMKSKTVSRKYLKTILMVSFIS